MSARADKTVACDLGVWNQNAKRLIPAGEVQWRGVPRRVYTASVGGLSLATVRRAVHQPTWLATMPGFMWDVAGDRGSTTTRALKIKSAPVRGFTSSALARKAVEAAYKALIDA